MYEIKLKINREADLYNPRDPEQVLLADDVVSYITRKYWENDHVDEYRLHIISDEPVNEDRVRKTILNYLDEENGIRNREMKISTIKQIRLLIIGVIFLGIWLWAEKTTDIVFAEILSIIGSFAVWEAADIWIAEKFHIRTRKIRMMILKNTEIVFSVEGKE